MKRLKILISIILTAVLLCAMTCTAHAAGSYFLKDGFYFGVQDGEAYIHGTDGSGWDIVIPEMFLSYYVTSIEEYAFHENNTIEVLSFYEASQLKSLGDGAFSYCPKLKRVHITESIEEMGVGVFEGCTALRSVRFRDGALTDVPAQCFYGCSALSNVIFDNEITSIGNLAFAGCTGLTELTIPASVHTIADNAFNNCDDLVIKCYTDSYAHQFAVEKGIEYVLLDAPAKEYFVGRSLSLDGDIGVNFYLDLTADEAKSAMVNFSWNVNNEVKTSSFSLSNAKRLTAGYKATCRIAPAEMTGNILAELLINDEKVDEERYSAKQYADVILSDSYQAAYKGTGARSYDNLKNLILNMLSFGSRAQTAFAVNLDTLADKGSGYTPDEVSAEDIPVANANMTEGLDNYGLSYVGSTLVCLTETTIRHYYKVTDQNKFDAVKNSIFIEGKPASAVEKNGSIYFEINNIPAADLDRNYTLKIGNNEYQYSAFNYIKTALPSNKVEDNVKKLIQVLYRYNQAANTFFA